VEVRKGKTPEPLCQIRHVIAIASSAGAPAQTAEHAGEATKEFMAVGMDMMKNMEGSP
jgi:hypothetical protein